MNGKKIDMFPIVCMRRVLDKYKHSSGRTEGKKTWNIAKKLKMNFFCVLNRN